MELRQLLLASGVLVWSVVLAGLAADGVPADQAAPGLSLVLLAGAGVGALVLLRLRRTPDPRRGGTA